LIAVVHLVWGPLGRRWLPVFLSSYRSRPAGAEHELVVLFNGVEPDARSELETSLEPFAHSTLTTPAAMQDIAAYEFAAARLPHERICFLNSYSEILVPDWLAKLDQALAQPGTGMVGATGSWASLHSAVLNAFLLPNPYRGTVPRRSVAREQMREIELELELGRQPHGDRQPQGEQQSSPELPPRTLTGSIVSTLRSLRPMPMQLLRYPPFPSCHLRTNAFMVDRPLFGSLRIGRVASKADAYLLESGRASFTRQLQRRGLRTLVVARDGSCYEQQRWPASRTFWQADQQQLLIADNQTRSYANGSLERRRLLSAFAWGPEAEPEPPRALAVAPA
jgi:hypothetical protein